MKRERGGGCGSSWAWEGREEGRLRGGKEGTEKRKGKNKGKRRKEEEKRKRRKEGKGRTDEKCNLILQSVLL